MFITTPLTSKTEIFPNVPKVPTVPRVSSGICAPPAAPLTNTEEALKAKDEVKALLADIAQDDVI